MWQPIWPEWASEVEKLQPDQGCAIYNGWVVSYICQCMHTKKFASVGEAVMPLCQGRGTGIIIAEWPYEYSTTFLGM